MKSWNLLIILVIALVVLAGIYIQTTGSDSGRINYITDKVIKGDISSTVTANGKIRPRERAEIRATIDGTVNEVLADINSQVEKGELLATLNDTLYTTRLKEAESKLNKARNELEIKKKLLESDRILRQKDLISNQEYQESVSQYKSSLALYEEAKATLEIANINMEATRIRSSINGIVLSRSIIEGQSVSAAGEDQPLFVVVTNLDRMQLVSDVSESDISQLEKGQKVKFRVSAFPDKNFSGEIIEISNNPKTENNIVSYEVIAEINNPDLILKPGMTAEVEIITSVRENVVKVPTSALRIVLPETANTPDIQSRKDNMQDLWIKNDNGDISRLQVKTGISDENYTEIIEGNISPGQKVITGISSTGGSDSDSLITLPQPKRF